MPQKQNREIGGLSKYDAMPTESLEEILRLDAEAPEEQEVNTDEILYIMEVLTKRKMNNGHTGKTAQEAFESFEENYMPEMEETKPTHRKPAAKRSSSRWFRSLTAAAAVVAILICGSITAKAFGFNIWKAVVQWTQETFHFGEWDKSNVDNSLQFASLQEALKEGNVPETLIPTWIPDGYEIVDIQVEYHPQKTAYKAQYINKEHILKITIQDYLDNEPLYVEQNDKLAEEYEVFGSIYYIFADIDLMKARWIDGSYEGSISGNLTIEELKMMIDSIKKG